MFVVRGALAGFMVLSVVTGGTRAAGSQEAQGGAQALFDAVLGRYAGYRDFQARFVETSASRASREGVPESGIVSFRRPALWRWEYLSPEKKLVVIRGKLATIAFDGEPEASRYELGDEGGESGVGVLLAGSERAKELFRARFEGDGRGKEPLLRLDPVRISDEFDYVLVRVRRSDLSILAVVVVDPGANELRFEFSMFRPDLGLAESLFDLAPAPSTSPPAAAAAKPAKPAPNP